MSEKRIEASHRNGTRSRGPKTSLGKQRSSQNSRRHGLLASSLIFESEEEEDLFRRFFESLHSDRNPVGAIENILVEEIAVNQWKLRILSSWEQEELHRKVNPQQFRPLLDNFMQNSSLGSLPIPGSSSGKEAGAGNARFLCRRLILRRDNDQRDEEVVKDERTSENKRSADVSQLELELSDPMETILRYRAAIKRDMFKAIDLLSRLQKERTEKEG